MPILLGIAFLAGVVTAISPCVLPVLPILLAGGATSSSRRRPFAIVAGLVLSFTLFTLAGAALLSALHLPEDLLRDVAIVALLVLAFSLVSRRVAFLLERPLLFLTRRRVSGDANGFVLGLSLGLVFVPCAGPVLAAMTAVAASAEVGLRIVLVTGAYALGAALPMLAVALVGRRLASSVRLLREHAVAIRAAAGVAIGAAAIAIAFGADQRFTTALPGYTEALQKRIERTPTAQRELRALTRSNAAPAASAEAEDAPRAPELRGIQEWLNTPAGAPLSLAGLRGKVVLVDFWTYSCINCLRTLPHLRAWYRAYAASGLEIVGVHSPEFAFERVPGNVRSAVRRLGIRYPVALDNDFATWRAYGNQYWPAKYLLDTDGRVRYVHFGEGAYDETEGWIRRLLGEDASAGAESVPDRTPKARTTPESYLGYARIARIESAVVFDLPHRYRFPERGLAPDELAFSGRWTLTPEHALAGVDARLRLRFRANDVFLVLAGDGRVEVRVDGRLLRSVAVSGLPRLYTLAGFPRLRRGLLELGLSPGLEAYAFTFG